MFNISKKKVWVAGHNGMVGSAIVRRLKKEECKILTANRKDLDLLNQRSTEKWMKDNGPEIIILAAAKVKKNGAASPTKVDPISANGLPVSITG